MKALVDNPDTDCVVFDCIYTVNGENSKLCKYGDILDGR